jgi:hypothetical protein
VVDEIQNSAGSEELVILEVRLQQRPNDHLLHLWKLQEPEVGEQFVVADLGFPLIGYVEGICCSRSGEFLSKALIKGESNVWSTGSNLG